MKQIAVLLNGNIINDSRVIRIVKTLSEENKLSLFYIDGTPKDKDLFNSNVSLYSFPKKYGLKQKLIQNTCFYNEYLFFVPAVLTKQINFDIIYTNDLPTLKPGIILKKKLGAKLIYDSHEIFNETLNQFFPNSNDVFKKIKFSILLNTMKTLGNVAEAKFVKEIDFFITTCESFKEYFTDKFKIKELEVIMNCPPLIKQEIVPVDLRERFNLYSTDVLCVFQGVMNKGRALFKLMEAFIMTNANIKLIMVGDGALKTELEKYVSDNKLDDKVFFTGRVKSSELLNYTKGCDIGINLQEPINISKKLASANKLFEYIHAGIPVIGSDVPENRRIINEFDLGQLVSNTPVSISNAINEMANSDLSIYKDRCKKAADKYNWENQAVKLKNILDRLF